MRKKILTYYKKCPPFQCSTIAKKVLIVVVIVMITLVVFFYFIGKANLSTKQNTGGLGDNGAGLILVLDYGATKKSFKFNEAKEERAWNLLQQVAAAKKIDLVPTNDFSPYKIGGFINSQSDKHWVFYLDGVKQSSSPYRIFVKPPAEVAFRYE